MGLGTWAIPAGDDRNTLYEFNQGTTCTCRSCAEDRLENSLEKTNLALTVGQVKKVEGLTQVRGKRAGEEGGRRGQALYIYISWQ